MKEFEATRGMSAKAAPTRSQRNKEPTKESDESVEGQLANDEASAWDGVKQQVRGFVTFPRKDELI